MSFDGPSRKLPDDSNIAESKVAGNELGAKDRSAMTETATTRKLDKPEPQGHLIRNIHDETAIKGYVRTVLAPIISSAIENSFWSIEPSSEDIHEATRVSSQELPLDFKSLQGHLIKIYEGCFKKLEMSPILSTAERLQEQNQVIWESRNFAYMKYGELHGHSSCCIYQVLLKNEGRNFDGGVSSYAIGIEVAPESPTQTKALYRFLIKLQHEMMAAEILKNGQLFLIVFNINKKNI